MSFAGPLHLVRGRNSKGMLAPNRDAPLTVVNAFGMREFVSQCGRDTQVPERFVRRSSALERVALLACGPRCQSVPCPRTMDPPAAAAAVGRTGGAVRIDRGLIRIVPACDPAPTLSARRRADRTAIGRAPALTRRACPAILDIAIFPPARRVTARTGTQHQH
jgi:hypothetical protein